MTDAHSHPTPLASVDQQSLATAYKIDVICRTTENDAQRIAKIQSLLVRQMTGENRQSPTETVSHDRPRKGEFWFVVYRGNLTVGHCYSAGQTTNLWEVAGRDILIDSTRPDFSEIQKIELPEQLTKSQRPAE